MNKTIHATFDGKVFRPEEPLSLAPDTRVLITIFSEEETEARRKSFLDTAMSMNLEGPPDWSERLEDYLYGTPDNSND